MRGSRSLDFKCVMVGISVIPFERVSHCVLNTNSSEFLCRNDSTEKNAIAQLFRSHFIPPKRSHYLNPNLWKLHKQAFLSKNPKPVPHLSKEINHRTEQESEQRRIPPGMTHEKQTQKPGTTASMEEREMRFYSLLTECANRGSTKLLIVFPRSREAVARGQTASTKLRDHLFTHAPAAIFGDGCPTSQKRPPTELPARESSLCVMLIASAAAAETPSVRVFAAGEGREGGRGRTINKQSKRKISESGWTVGVSLAGCFLMPRHVECR
ncbi:hypothetical protein CEXT_347981 [Caerostris extrusa]|uniref:Uncharacterized protein n=1 Tax=Caerostris extrusa TaxID=172846 RepID=A0AAV4S374_CAEEX|nr:hypothetical protein CEXT_347981 [Caerostris extrusa]